MSTSRLPTTHLMRPQTQANCVTCNRLFLQKLFLWMFQVWGLMNWFSWRRELESRLDGRPPGHLRCVFGVGPLSVLQWGDPGVCVYESVGVTVLECWVVCGGTCVCVCVCVYVCEGVWACERWEGVKVWIIKHCNICSHQARLNWHHPLHSDTNYQFNHWDTSTHE